MLWFRYDTKTNVSCVVLFVAAWIKSMILTPKKLTFKPTNLYYEYLKNIENRKVRKEKKNRKKEASQSIEDIK